MQQTKSTLKLTVTQTCMTVNFYEAAIESPKLTFEEVVLRELGPKGFPKTRNIAKFNRECREMFDQGRRELAISGSGLVHA